jgi:hypothetical protein
LEYQLAKEPHSQIALILKQKYHHDTSMWRAKSNKAKSAFWAAVLKVRPLLISASSYQIVDGNSSVWSSPWFSRWEEIYDHLIIQERPFVYPATVKDLWLPNQKAWNANLINTLFTTEIANDILQTPIVNAVGQDILIWKLTPAGKFSSKSAYKHCFINLDLPVRQRPKTVHPQTIALLNQVWQDKHMIPRVQTFAWRLLRKALPTGKRASKFSIHIQENCSRCDNTEDEMHMLFLCPYSKAAWFCSPWFIKTEILAANNHSVPDMIQSLLNSGHPQINLTSLYTFLWCLWKSRNNALFARKYCRPSQVFAAANAIIQATKLEGGSPTEDHSVTCLQDHLLPPRAIQNPDTFAGNTIFCDAAWEIQSSNTTKQAGIGVFIEVQNNQHIKQLHVSAMSPAASSPLQAETFGLMLATRLAEILKIQEPHFLTDCSVLA